MRPVWTIGLSLAIRDALRAGDLYLADSRHHASFWHLVYDDHRWQTERRHAYETLVLPTAADDVLGRLRQEYPKPSPKRSAGWSPIPSLLFRETACTSNDLTHSRFRNAPNSCVG